MTDLTLKENEQWLNGYKAGYAQAQETNLAMPRKEWVGLTAYEIASIPLDEHTLQTAEKMLKILKDKNT